MLLARTASESYNLSEFVIRSTGYLAPLAVADAALSLVIVEVWGIIGATISLVRRLLMVLGEYIRKKFNLDEKKDESGHAKPVPQDAHRVDRPPRAFRSTPPGKVRIEDSEE